MRSSVTRPFVVPGEDPLDPNLVAKRFQLTSDCVHRADNGETLVEAVSVELRPGVGVEHCSVEFERANHIDQKTDDLIRSLPGRAQVSTGYR